MVQEFTSTVEVSTKTWFYIQGSPSGSVTGLLGSRGFAPSLPEARLSSDPAIPVETKGRVLLPAIPCISACVDGLFTSNCFNLLMQQKSRQVNGLSAVLWRVIEERRQNNLATILQVGLRVNLKKI